MPECLAVNLDDLERGKDRSTNYVVKPGDRLVIRGHVSPAASAGSVRPARPAGRASSESLGEAGGRTLDSVDYEPAGRASGESPGEANQPAEPRTKDSALKDLEKSHGRARAETRPHP